jgi:hypothetical protein
MQASQISASPLGAAQSAQRCGSNTRQNATARRATDRTML